MSNAPESTSSRLRRLADPIWQAQHTHPFVCGIGDGTLAPARFAYWVRQDYLFLLEYARLFALGAARASTVEDMATFATLLHGVLYVELDLHRRYCAGWDITPAQLAAEERAPTTQAYTDFLVRTAAMGEYAELVAALLPCMWGFAELAGRLREYGMPADGRYCEWIEMYTSAQFLDLVQWSRRLVDNCPLAPGDVTEERMQRAFFTSSRYELAFWEMGWRQERWTV